MARIKKGRSCLDGWALGMVLENVIFYEGTRSGGDGGGGGVGS